MSFQDKLEKSPWRYLIGAISSTALIIFGILQYFHSERIKDIESSYQRKLDECNNTLTSINRGLAGNTKIYFNVSRAFVKATDKLEDASKLIFYNSDEFYALADSSHWKHKLVNTYVSAMDFSKLDKMDRSKAIEILKKHKSKIHFWEGGKLYKIQKSKFLDSLGYGLINTSISVEKANIDTLALLNAEAQQPGHTEEFKKFYRKQGLMSTFLFFIEQQRLITSRFPEVSFEIQDIQSQDKFLYLNAISQLKNIIVNGEHKENFYLKYESFGLLNENDIYIITIVEPVTDPLYSDPEITRWLNSLKIIIK
jgi:hypothetical protein